jgi:membrane protein DedA with SNARE-associated domain
VTGHITTFVAAHGIAAVFALMAVDAILPAGSELVMLLSGAVAVGAFGDGVTFLGHPISSGVPAFAALVAAGTLGYLLGALAGWLIGVRGGRPLLERHGRWLHLGPERVDRAERWFDRFGDSAVLVGRITPLVRSFVSIPAGVLGCPLGRYTALTFAGSLAWCLAFAGLGAALGSNYDAFHRVFDHVEILLVVILVVVAAGAFVVRARRGGVGSRERV